MNKLDLQAQLKAVETFMASAAFKSYVFTKTQDLKAVQEQILVIRPTMETLPTLNELHGRQAQLVEDVTFFEDSRSLLKGQLDQLENPNSATNTDANILHE
jgi:hypothetical protein